MAREKSTTGAWFEKNPPEVQNFEQPDCTHFQLFGNSGEDRSEYMCTRCGVLFTVTAKE